ncbi:hypothetical protein [Saccharopolyspora shandongensis]|uniref:hypothetical protein n=1 Tax=Saccharopolyspora shandongensis TaxID=418495 RepID=UPI0033F8E1FC
MDDLADEYESPRLAVDLDPHERLLELAGRAPDGWLAVAREVLAGGDRQRLDELVGALLPRLEGRPVVQYRFTPDADGAWDGPDRAVVASVRAAHGTAACWATMRDGVDRVYLVQAGDGANLPAVTLAVQRVAGHQSDPRVEVFAAGTDLPDYHKTALRSAVLLWTREPPAEVKVARTFDGASGDGGPWFDSAHELVVDSTERQRLLDFLSSGEIVLETDLRMTDLVSGAAGAVPASLRSDGVWVWSDASRYYLDRHLLAPDAALAAHALASGRASRMTPLDRYRVCSMLNPENEEGPLWRAE